MPNYQKYKQSQKNKRNKNKNKNAQQSKTESKTVSSSVRQQELSVEYETVGIEPNLLANSPGERCVGGDTFTSVQLDIEKGVIDDSSPSSNEEIDENACTVDTDTCISDSKTVMKQTNYSSSFCRSSNVSTEFERISKRTVFDGDSLVAGAVIRDDSIEDNSRINSAKTGSPHSKEAAVSTAVTSTTKSTGAVKKSKKGSPSGSPENEDQPCSVSSSTSQSSRVVVHRSVEETTEKSQEIKPDCSDPSLATSMKVIVHEIAKEQPSDLQDAGGSTITVHKVEESKTTSHKAVKKETIQSTTTKKKAVRSNTRDVEQPARVIVHQISREDDGTKADKVIVQQASKEEKESLETLSRRQQTSKVIVHQISQENDEVPKTTSFTEQSSEVIVEPISRAGDLTTSSKTEQISKVIVHKSSEGTDDTLKTSSFTEQTSNGIQQPISSKVIVHQISQENDKAPKTTSYTEQSSEMVVEPITRTSDLTTSSKTEQISKVIVHKSSEGTDETLKTSSFTEQTSNGIEQPISKTTTEPTSKVIVHQIAKEDEVKTPDKPIVHQSSTSANESVTSTRQGTTEKVILNQIFSTNTSQLADGSTSITFSRDLPTEEVKVRAHQITLEDTAQPSGDSLKDAILVDDFPRGASHVICHQTESERFEKTNHEEDSFVSTATQQKIIKSSDTEEALNDVQTMSASAGESPKPTAESLQGARASESSGEQSQQESSTTRRCPASFPVSTANDELQPLDVYFERISRSRSPEPEKFIPASEPTQEAVIVHPILQDKETQISPPDSPEIRVEHTIITNGLGDQTHPPPEPLQKTSFPVYRSPKVIVHQIHHEGPVKPAFPLTANSMEKLNHSSKQIASRILQDVSSELKSTFASEARSRITKEIPAEPVRTAFPLATLCNGQLKTSFSDFSVLLSDSGSTTESSSPKVIVHQIAREEETTPEAGSSKMTTEEVTSSSQSEQETIQNQTEITSPSPQGKVIVHQISREELPSTSSTQVTSDFRSESTSEHRTQAVSRDEVDSKLGPESPGSRVIIHPIVREEASPPTQFPKTKEDTHISSVASKGFPDTNAQPKYKPALSDLEEKLKVFKALKEELKLSAQFQQKVDTAPSAQVPPTSFPVSSPRPTPKPSLVVPAQPRDDAAPKSPQTPEESISSSSSGDTIHTAIRVQSPQLMSPPDTSEQEPSAPAKSKSPRPSFFLTSLEMSQPVTPPRADSPDTSDTETLHGEPDIPADEAPVPAGTSVEVIRQSKPTEEIPKEPAKVIIHPIVRDLSSEKILAYRVESPQPEQRLIVMKKSKSFDDDDVVIQEMSDTSSAGDTDNPPVVSEAESETDTLEAVDDFPDTPLNSGVLSVQTLPIDHEDDSQGPLSPKSSQNYKARRQQNRAALESHFLPQFLSPIYLDSIKEENSDLSDSERRSECSDRADHPPQQGGDLEDDVFHEDGPHAKKADAVFPKSNLDFSKKHIHVHTNIRPPKASVIREEAPPPSVVEAKIIDQGSVEESCSSWSTDLTPESEAAEVVYIDSASSSVSDLLELDYSQGQAHDSELDSLDVRIQTPTIGLESINDMFSRPRAERDEPPPPPPSPTLPPVKENSSENSNEKPNEKIGEKIPSPPLASIADDRVTITSRSTAENTKTTHSTVEHTLSNENEIILEKIETVSATVAPTDRDDDDRDAAAAASDRTQTSKANNPNSCDSAISEVVANATPDIAVGRSEKMESIREIVSSSVKSDLDKATDAVPSDQGIRKPEFKIGEPCSDYTLNGDITSATSPLSVSSSTSTSTTTSSCLTKTTTTSGTQILTLHDLRMNLGDTRHLHPLGGGSSALDRQESLDSHGSDQSQSTNQSQCTAINQGSLPNCEWNEFDTTTDTTYVSGSDTACLASSENSSPVTTGANRAGAKTESPPIKKLRSLCTEALASMPFGEEVLEELATVAKNIQDMPYPLPELPHIQDIQVSLQSGRSQPQPAPPTSSVITLTQMPPTPSGTSVGQKLRSPPPPPVPEPPSKYDSWLGVPTKSDPNVLVCLSPSQRAAVADNTTPDSLLDMHKKFVERRGYHEFTTKQVKAMNDENVYETVTLRKSNSPPPPPLPPRPQQSAPQAPQAPQAPPPATPANGNGTQSEAAADIFADDQNNHRLLAIIRDTHDSQHQHQHREHQSTTTTTSENISRRTESTAHTNTPATPTTGGGDREEFANRPSVSKQTQERYVSESNQSQSAQEKMQTEHTVKRESEPVMGLRFPTSEYFDSIFSNSGTSKRSSNIETGPSPGFCAQFLSAQPKRYSNVETSSFESRKCVENGKVLYDVTDRAHEKVVEGEKPDAAVPPPTAFPEYKPATTNGFNRFPANVGYTDKTDSRTQTGSGSENIMSAFNLKTQTDQAPPPTSRVEASPPAPPVPPLPANLAETTATTATTASTMKSTSTSESVINRNFNAETKETIFDDFRQRAKEAAAEHQPTAPPPPPPTTTKTTAFDNEKVFKDFDELSKLLKDELESGKRRPPATLDASQIPASVSDYNRVATESRIQSNHVTSSTSEQTRRAQMKKLADEIDRTATQRQRQRQVRIPITVEKPTPTPPRYPPEPPTAAFEQSSNFKKWSHEAERVNQQSQRTYEIPIQVEKETRAPRAPLQSQRSYEIPIRVEPQTEARQRTFSERRQSQGGHEAPQTAERTREESQRFRRAESMFNISDTSTHKHMLHDDWMKYVGDLGSSENICKPFQREVEICYMGRRPNIRAPRLSASTSDLSSTQCYDTYGAYDVRRSTNNQTPRPQQPPRRYHSTQSMIDTTPITSCVSSRRSPAPERRSSLPRELHDKQLKYISSREHQLQVEFERLENERRQLIDEMNRAQINQRLNREAYRQRQLPPLTEDESFRQQMAEEWLDKVAEREERRLQKIIKISKVNQEENFPAAPPRGVAPSDIGDEFLRRVKERRSKLCMPSDSDWESGAESQPAPRADGNRSETEEPPVTVLEGQSAADLKHLPKHLREFAKLTSQVKEEHREETTENTSCSATKKSSVVTTVKTTNAQAQPQPQPLQPTDAARARDLEQLSQGKRQKVVTILRHKKPAESGSDGSCQPAAVATSAAAGGAKRRKQTRFLLTPNRRSWSESDLLREIDKDLVLAKGFLYANGVWTPKNQTPTSSRSNLNEFQSHNTTATSTSNSSATGEHRSSSACEHSQSEKGIPTPPPPPLWTPQPERKQFRPVHFESPLPQRKYVRQQSTPSEAAAPPPWSYTSSKPFPGYQSQSCTNLNHKNTAIPWPPSPSTASPQNGTPVVEEPVTADEDGFPPTTSIAEKIRSFERSTSYSELQRPFVRHNPHEKPAILRPNEVIFSVKNEYMSEPETEHEKPKKMAQLSRRQYDGIGPTTNDGMPVVLRSEVKEPNQHEWYKRIFQTIHKQKNPDDYVTIRYKCPRGRYAYKANGYMSEPEPNYDSDYSTVKYRTLERRRLQSTGTGTEAAPLTAVDGGDSQTDTFYGTMPNPVKSGQGSYKVQPGRIEDYVTGHSSVSEKEKKEWWDEVMDIFNGWLKDNDPLPRAFIDFANEVEQFHLDQQKLSPHYTQGNLSRALLKEQGYTSDSNIVFRKKDVPQSLQSPLSPVEQKQVYKSVQAGGQPPLLGFRKPAPEKPKETEFEYLPITSTLTKIRVHSKNAMSKKSQTTHAAQRELICYPIASVSRPIDMFASFPKHVPSFIPMNQPPLPPNRKSSRTRASSMALKISSSEVKRPTSANSSRHEACFRSKDGSSPPPPRPTKFGTITLRKTVKRTEPLLRSKSAGAVLTLLAASEEEKSKDGRVSRKLQTVRLSSSSPVRSASRLSTLRTTSRSPVAFGRSVSKERSFAEEKKRIEQTMPSVRTDFTASTNILRDPSLKSPDQVKRAVRSYACPMERSKSVPKVLSLAKPAYSTARRVPSPPRKESSVVRLCHGRSPTRTSVVVRSKSQSSRLSERTTARAITKTSSTVSLARTSSTFSVDSTASKARPAAKKPPAITRPSARADPEKARRKPVTISSSKSDSNVLQKIKESSEAKQKLVKAIPSQQKAVRSNHFFTKLFMPRDTSPKKTDAQPVRERARHWNTMSLPPRTTTHESRHLKFDHYRSLSPPARPHYEEHYETVEQFSDNEASEFGDLPGRTESLVWQYEQGSFMDAQPMRPVCDIARPDSPAAAFAREFSPTREIRVPQCREMRSPSRRRIQSHRGSQRGETGKVIRASSLSSADDRVQRSLYHCEDISHSANSLEYIERHSPSCRFKNSDRFIDLNRFYSTLERVGQLERATSATCLKPIRKEGQPLDFEEWRRLRFHERAERELNYLVGRLKEDQKQGDFLFRPKDVDDIKWSGNKDLSLRSRDKSVEDLRENFEKKIHEEWLDESKRLELEATKDTYKPYWRGSSVADLASSMEVKYNPDSGSFGVRKVAAKEAPKDNPLCLSNRLISTLSKDQVSKITQQLNEIYNASEPKAKPDVTEEYVITVGEHAPANALKVRCNSTISKEELIGPVLRRKEAAVKPPQSKAVGRVSRDDDMPEREKRRLSLTLSREIQSKARAGSPVMLARETRGAIAAGHAKSTLPDIPPPPPLPKAVAEPKKPAPAKPKRKAIEGPKETAPRDPQTVAVEVETTATETVEKPEDTVSRKIQYFEERQFEEPAKTIYHAREDSSPDEDEIMRVIEENIKARAESGRYRHQELTSSTTDLRDLFGEREASRTNFPLPRPPPPPDETIYRETNEGQHRSTSLTVTASRDGSLENLESLFRSRSISPQASGTPYLHRVHTGEVRKIKDKFESLGRPSKKKHFFALSPLRKVRSDPELNNEGSKDTFKTVVRENEAGDVSWITHKFEAQSAASRGRSRCRKPSSPIQRMPLRKEDRLMPHIDIISKTASLKQEMMKSRSPSPVRQPATGTATPHAGEVERIRVMFETSPDRDSSLDQPRLGTSSPELRDISTHLTASWIAHKYPKPDDNDLRSPPPPLPEKTEQSVSLPTIEVKRPERIYRSRSISPPKAKRATPIVSILKPRFDFFANQKFDPSIHRPKARYVPDDATATGEDAPQKSNPPASGSGRKPAAVKFKDSDDVPPPPPVPPTKGVPLDLNGFSNLESPNRYFESDVNIHYKTPIRYENKEPIPEEELAIRQAELMQKLYQEERRRKYLQELQDMNSRRHTDNFTPSQKSPIPLNRYDDFNSDLAPKSPNSSTYPKTVARALYNFQGQTARELTFKKGDVIYIRRQIDKNWYEGEHNAMIGLLPSNYVEIITKDGVRQPPKKPSEGQARAKYNFQAQSGIELSLNKGELVTLTRRVDDNWFEGKIANRKGIFPVSYVEVLVDIGAEDRANRTQSAITQSSAGRPSLDTLRTNINNEFNSLTSNGQHPNGILKETRTLHKTEVLHVDTNTEPVAYRALYKYRPQNTDELELQEGDIVFVLEKCDDGWFVGTSQRSGCFGTFPGNYVERV